MTRLFVSDLHLTAEEPAAIEQFLAFLEREARGAQALYILGDLFEAWVGDDDPQPVNARVGTALRAVADAGVAVFALHGNRDFLLGADFARSSGCYLLPDPALIDIDGEAVLITHGDSLCIDDHAYQELRSIVRAPRWQQRFLALPVSERVALAELARAGSRAHTARTVPYIMDVNAAAVLAAFRASGADRIIHGHTHRPAVHELEVDGRRVRRVVLGAWYEQGSYLRCATGAYELCVLERSSSQLAGALLAGGAAPEGGA